MLCFQLICSFYSRLLLNIGLSFNKGADGAERGIVFPPEKTKKHHFGVIFGTVGTVIGGRLQEARKSS